MATKITKSEICDENDRVADGKYLCSLCGKWLKILSKNKHKRAHTQGKQYQCPQQCGKSFFDKQALKVHIRSHTGERPYPCEECNSHFITSSNLKNHEMAVHSSRTRKFACDLCEKKFFDIYNLKTHQMVHADQRTFTCSKCRKSFLRKQYENKYLF